MRCIIKGLHDICFFSGDINFNVVSLAEKKIGKLLDTESDGVARYTRSTLIRTYPAGTRTDSSNYNPVPMWCGGCQVGRILVFSCIAQPLTVIGLDKAAF